MPAFFGDLRRHPALIFPQRPVRTCFNEHLDKAQVVFRYCLYEWRYAIFVPKVNVTTVSHQDWAGSVLAAVKGGLRKRCVTELILLVDGGICL